MYAGERVGDIDMRLLGLLLIVGVLALGSLGGDVRADAYDCDDFASRAEAQAFFEAHGGPEVDPYYLDADRDGRACELGVDGGTELPSDVSETSRQETPDQVEIRYERCEDAAIRAGELLIELGPIATSSTQSQQLSAYERGLLEEYRHQRAFLDSSCGDAKESIRTRLEHCMTHVGLLAAAEASWGFPAYDQAVASSEEAQAYQAYRDVQSLYITSCRFPDERDFNPDRRCRLWQSLHEAIEAATAALPPDESDPLIISMAQAAETYALELERLREMHC